MQDIHDSIEETISIHNDFESEYDIVIDNVGRMVEGMDCLKEKINQIMDKLRERV